jgi:hypothetical protein
VFNAIGNRLPPAVARFANGARKAHLLNPHLDALAREGGAVSTGVLMREARVVEDRVTVTSGWITRTSRPVRPRSSARSRPPRTSRHS